MSEMSQYKISVIVPVYNARNTIEKCIRSLFEQTLDSIEYIIIDDNSTDGSCDVISQIASEYPNRLKHLRIVRHDRNRGVGKSRQEGINIARGEYMIHCDADDWLDLDAYETLYNEARDTDAEICMCDYIEETPEGAVIKKQVPAADKKQLFYSIYAGKIHASLCNKLISHKFWNSSGCRIAGDLSLWEDMSVILPLLIYSHRITHVDKALYHYRIGNTASITGTPSKEKIISQVNAVESIKTIITKWNLYSTYKHEIDRLMLRASHYLIASKYGFDPIIWREVNDVSLSQLLKLRLPLYLMFYYALAMLRLDFIMRLIVNMRSYKTFSQDSISH